MNAHAPILADPAAGAAIIDPARPPALAIDHLSVAYHDLPVLDDVSWTVGAGRLAAIVGPNGAGKSTLIKASLGLVPALGGGVAFFGEPLSTVRERVGYVPQRASVEWDFPVSALDVVTMGLYGRIGWFRRVRRSHREKAREALATVGLGDFAERQIGELSGGQQQRVFLARALVQDADLYIMDEPLAGVDAATEQTIVDILRRLRQSGRSVVVVHHDLSTVPTYFDDVLLLAGRVVAAGSVEAAFTPENLMKTYGGRLAVLDRAGGRAGLPLAA